MRTSPTFKFVYLGYRKNSKLGTKCIYDIEILQPANVDWEDYFTLSSEGLTHYKIATMGMTEVFLTFSTGI